MGRHTKLTELPPELLNHIISYLPTSSSVLNLGASSKPLHKYIETDGWQIFASIRFPSLIPGLIPAQDSKAVARSLTTLSRAWDRRAFVARYIEPSGHVTSYPGASKVERWKKPRGQTIGFTPQLDVYEEVGPRWRDRKEILAFSAGAEICVRQKRLGSGGEEVRWMTYRPFSSYEGRDDITTLHLLREPKQDRYQRLITGTASGDLWICQIPNPKNGDVPITYFVTQGLPVRSSTVLQHEGGCLLAANLGESKLAIYPINPNKQKIEPVSSVNIQSCPPEGQSSRKFRLWSTAFLSAKYVAAGLGPAADPTQLYAVTPSGLEDRPYRKFGLLSACSSGDIRVLNLPKIDGISNKTSSSIYSIVPLPPSSTASGSGDGVVFLSGAYDGVIRLHDLRSQRDVEVIYVDRADDSAIYSLLPRGQEALLAGTSRHSLLKIFDLRFGAKCYSYKDASRMDASDEEPTKDWSLFLRPASPQQHHGWGRRTAMESSIYSLASPSPASPFVFAGVENAVAQLAFTSVLDKHPDPVHFTPWRPPPKGSKEDGWRSREVLDLAMYDQNTDVKLFKQRSLYETWRCKTNPVGHTLDFPVVNGLDERWTMRS